MIYCKNCGKPLDEDSKFCSSCGTPVSNNNQSQYQQSNSAYQQPNQNYQQPYNFTQTPEQIDAKQNKAMGILAYFGFLVLVPIFAAKDSKFAQFHASQGVNLALLEIAIELFRNIGFYFVSDIFGFSVWSMISGVFSLLSLATFALAIFGIVNACKGEMKQLPVIGQYDILGKIMEKINNH